MSFRVAISGGSGMLGSHCIRHLLAKSYQVLALTRKPMTADERSLDLGTKPDPKLFEGVDAFIHCAYDFSAFGKEAIWRTNVEGTKNIFSAAKQAGVSKLVFISSVSAFEGCESLYGKAKLEAENFVLSLGGIVLRPGLIWGSTPPKGMVSLLEKVVGLPVVPVVGAQRPMVLIHIEDLVCVIEKAVDGTLSEAKAYTVAHSEPIYFINILKTLARRKGSSPLFIPIPEAPLLAALRFVEFLGVIPPFRSDNLLGLIRPNPDFYRKLSLEPKIGAIRPLQ